ncbi:MAG TPA: BMP family ABC transporter substrate-binding protein [Dehalococcoidia bacterium]|nr:BMP family ABC transporter substrate-binding protein [Dehalococcoidia bacterium]
MQSFVRKCVPLPSRSMGLSLAVFALIFSLACGASTTPAPAPTSPTAAPVPPTSAPAPDSGGTDSEMTTPGMVPMTSPSVDDLGGGSPELFGKVFQEGIASSPYRATSEFARAAQSRAGGEKLKVGFIFVGSQKDLGYNQAAAEGSQWLEQNHPDLEILRVENVPETAEVQTVQEQMISQGAEIIFATSFGYSGPTKALSDKHPDVVFLHQGDLESKENYGAYFGNIWQLEYASGQVAGKMTQSNQLGFIAAFPIPQTLLNVNAFHLGARSVNPDVETTFVLTSSWCDPAKQTNAVQAMINSGIDVLTQHQDCTKTIVEAAERSEVYVTGYHQDASPAAPNSWLTGAAWNWGPVYSELVSEIQSGSYKSSVIFGGLDAGWVKLAPFGQKVPDDVKQMALDTVEGLRNGSINPFTGPIKDQKGDVRIAEGMSPSDTDLQTIDWLVEGVTGRTQ